MMRGFSAMRASRYSVLLLPPFVGLALRVSASWRRTSKPAGSSRDLCAQNASQECIVKRIEGRIAEENIEERIGEERIEEPVGG